MGRRSDVVIDSEKCLLSCVSHLALVTPFLDKAFVEVQYEIAVCDVWCNPEGDQEGGVVKIDEVEPVETSGPDTVQYAVAQVGIAKELFDEFCRRLYVIESMAFEVYQTLAEVSKIHASICWAEGICWVLFRGIG